jgi:hypothetical protein
VQGVTGISAILVGGTALLIAVTVLLDLIRKVDAQQPYEATKSFRLESKSQTQKRALFLLKKTRGTLYHLLSSF